MIFLDDTSLSCFLLGNIAPGEMCELVLFGGKKRVTSLQ